MASFTAISTINLSTRSSKRNSTTFTSGRTLVKSVLSTSPNYSVGNIRPFCIASVYALVKETLYTVPGCSSKSHEQSLKLEPQILPRNEFSGVIEAKKGNPPIMPAVMTPAGPLDLSSLLFRNRIIFIGQPVNAQVAQRVISQLLTLAALDEEADILVYINCPGGSTYSVLAIYDCMSWIKPKVGTVCFGLAASQGALLLAAGEKGMRYAMPNARIMIHQPQSGCGGHVEDVRRQVNEAVQARHKIDRMYAAFTGQPLDKVQQYTERDRFFSAAESLEFGLIDGLLETLY